MGANASTQAPPPPSENPESKCPVDHKTREIWLQQNKGSAGGAPHPIPSSSDNNGKPIDEKSTPRLQRQLSNDREVSTIPRAFDTATDASNSQTSASSTSAPSPYAVSSAASHSSPSNAESETGHDLATGNWVYPSERQFFDALVRKNNVPGSTTSAKELATSVASIIPIHNAVNEKAWQEILKWESRAPSSDPGSNKCGGPKLYSFRGLGTESQFVSPRARINGLMGYQLPFDRHDWVVERCGGERVEYVIDFYQGKPAASPAVPSSSSSQQQQQQQQQQQNGQSGIVGATGPGKLSFYLDVRPKLNSYEGWRLRFNRYWGL